MGQADRARGLRLLPVDASLGALARRARELANLRRALADRLAPGEAEHLAGVSLTGDRLTVFADSPVWCTRLRFQAGALEPEARMILGRTVRLAFRTQPPAFRARKRPALLSPAAAATLRSAARTISDPALAAALGRLADGQPATGPQAGPA